MKLSVIIATHAREASLAGLLESLAPQLNSDREILIADNGTLAPSPVPSDVPILAHIHDPRPGKCRVQNAAIARSSGEIKIFLDDDLTVAADYLDRVAEFFAMHPEFAAMKGRIIAAEDPIAKAGAMWPYVDLPISDHGSAVVEVRGVLGANMAFRADALADVGAFDERLGPGACGHEEETEMSARLRRHGFRIGYCPGALVYHEVDPARANRERYIRIARERGRCRMLHEEHGIVEVASKCTIGVVRLAIAKAVGANVERIAREERRYAVALGMLDGLRRRSAN
ncbi:MAG TPA: glycosyltransferase family 2 protein [Candidatus Binataceae bacterium]|nr:glycosyltransferase family 2 protein [Candidatus Binataceae bacterium]